MVSIAIPKILFNGWFWIGLMAIIIIIHFFWGKTPPPPKPNKFFTKHKKTITKICDIFLIFAVLFGWLLLIPNQVMQVLHAQNTPQQIRATEIHSAWAMLLMLMIACSGLSGALIGLLSVFQSNLTKVKRTILLIICLLPMSFTIVLLPIQPLDNLWTTIKLGLIYSSICWIINGPAILTGKHFLQMSWAILRKLRLVSGDYQD